MDSLDGLPSICIILLLLLLLLLLLQFCVPEWMIEPPVDLNGTSVKSAARTESSSSSSSSSNVFS